MILDQQQLDLNCLQQDRLYLTANSRLAEYIAAAYAAQQPNIFKPLRTYSLENYCKKLGNEYFATEHLLTSNAASLIWQKLMPAQFKCISGSSSLAHKAWQLCQAWQVSDQYLENCHYHEVAVFLQWKNKFIKYCQEKKLLCIEQVYERIINNPELFAEKFSDIHWVGFQEFTPQLQRLQAAIEIKQQNNYLASCAKQHQVQSFAADDKQQLWQAMCDWAKQKDLKQPYSAICAIPGLNAAAEEVSEILHANFPEHSLEQPVFNISMSQKLIEFPLFASIMNILKSQHTDFSITDFCSMLRSGLFCKDIKSRLANAELELALRKKLDLSCSKSELIKFLGCRQEKLPAAANWLDYFTTQPTTETQLPGAWLIELEQWQATCKWPGQLYNNNYGAQLWEQWLTIKQQINRLDYILDEISYDEFYEIILQILQKSQFQFYKNKTAPLQILGVVEAAGLPCENLWFANCDANSWPPNAQPNPFLPYDLQRKLGMPQASADREYKYAAQISDTLLSQANSTVLAYSRNHDNAEQELSPIFDKTHLQQITITGDATQQWQCDNISTIDDIKIPEITKTTEQAGGSGLLQSVATCPLQSQLRWRLRLQQTEIWRLAPDARARGSALHSCMEYIYQRITCQQELNSLSAQEKTSLIAAAINSSNAQNPGYTTNSQAWQENETALLTKLIRRWLDLESERPDFTIESCEQTSSTQINNLQLKLRIDRIDNIAGDKKLIIDYKTGACSNRQLLEENTTATQLPLYLYNNRAQVAAVAFGQVNSKTVGMVGLSEHDTAIDGIKPCQDYKTDWQELQATWDEHLEDLATKFCNSDASLAPHNKQACSQCEFLSICEAQNHV